MPHPATAAAVPLLGMRRGAAGGALVEAGPFEPAELDAPPASRRLQAPRQGGVAEPAENSRKGKGSLDDLPPLVEFPLPHGPAQPPAVEMKGTGGGAPGGLLLNALVFELLQPGSLHSVTSSLFPSLSRLF
ncbi:hypothetical protein MASR2M17_08110 [Aminivibrio sp.]